MRPEFSDAERAILLSTSGIGQGVVDRIESLGVHTLQQLHDIGVDMLVAQICAGMGNDAWRNRRRALARALARLDLPVDQQQRDAEPRGDRPRDRRCGRRG